MPRGVRRREQGEVPAGPAGDELLTVSEVAELLRVDETTVRRWVKLGALEAVTLPHVNKRAAYRIRRGVIDAVTEPRKLERSRA